MKNHRMATIIALAALALTCPSGPSRAQTSEAALPPANPINSPTAETSPSLIPSSLAVDFEPGSAWLTDQAITGLDYFTFYHILKRPDQKVRIIVHPDESGLMDRRAEAVAAYIESKGVLRTDMTIENTAMEAPAVPNDREAAPRIEISAR